MLNEAGQQLEKLKASIRARVEHPFAIIKRQFGYGRVRYRGLKKSANRLYVLRGLAWPICCWRTGLSGMGCRISASEIWAEGLMSDKNLPDAG